ncbi:MAG: ankyrin repeat domain-containing protein [Pseudanabaena sp.]
MIDIFNAIQDGDILAAERAIKSGEVDVNQYLDEYTLLGWAAEHKQLKLVKLLLKKGADVNFSPHFQVATPLMDAIASGDLKIIQALIEAGAEPNLIICEDYPLLLAAGEGNKKIFDFLLPLTREDLRGKAQELLETELKKKAPKINSTKNLFKAISEKSIPKMLKSIENGADVNSINIDNFTPIMCVILLGEKQDDIVISMAKILLENGADPNLGTDRTTPIVMAMQYDSIGIAELLIKFGLDVNAKMQSGEPLLNFISSMGDFNPQLNKFIPILINAGANVNFRNEYGLTALSFALNRNSEAVRLLREAGAIE